MKTCPDCAEEVQDEARVCRYCGFRFDRGPSLMDRAKSFGAATREVWEETKPDPAGAEQVAARPPTPEPPPADAGWAIEELARDTGVRMRSKLLSQLAERAARDLDGAEPRMVVKATADGLLVVADELLVFAGGVSMLAGGIFAWRRVWYTELESVKGRGVSAFGSEIALKYKRDVKLLGQTLAPIQPRSEAAKIAEFVNARIAQGQG